MSNRAKAIDRIKELLEKYGYGGYIFRGTTTIHSNETKDGKIYDGINSTLYRWVVRKEEKEKGAFNDEEHETLKGIFAENEHFFPATMEKEISVEARKMSQSNAVAHEVLTDLQHFGGKTNMIDFSHNIYIALFFACQGKFGKPGELIALHKSKLNPVYEIDLFKRPQMGDLEVIAPAIAESSFQRVHFQSSIFVRPTNGYINPKICGIERITADIKEPILEYLRKERNIEPNTVYNDLHGFIKNQKNNETASLYFYMGLTSSNNGNNKKAIEYYDKSIERNPNMPVSYNNRGKSYGALGQHVRAIEDFKKCISLNPNFFRAYNNRGVAYKNLGQLERAIEDYNKAISLKPDYAQAYNNRGNVYSFWGDDKQALRDYNKAISIDSGFADAYYNRGELKSEIGDEDGAKEDYAKAKELGILPPEENNSRFARFLDFFTAFWAGRFSTK